MSNDLEKLIEEFVVPEMEYSPTYEKKHKGKGKQSKTVTIDEVPEFVLPKTKQEVYREAQGRLKQKTSAVSRSSSESRHVTTEVAATTTRTRAVHTESEPAVMLADTPVWVGGTEDLVPFAWRNPLVSDLNKPTKYYKQAVREAKELLLPVHISE